MNAAHDPQSGTGPKEEDFILSTVHSSKLIEEVADLTLHHEVKGPLHEFSEKLLRDHSRLDDDLRHLGERNGVDIPMVPDEDIRLTIGGLSEAKPQEFPERCLSELVECLARLYGTFEDASVDSKDEETRSFARQYLPELKANRREAEMLETVY